MIKVARRCIIYPAAWLRRRTHSKIEVVGITGSAGKTMTKDLCATILSEFGPCVRTSGSKNLRLDVAETVLNIRKHHRYCVIELSGSRPGALDLQLKLTRPRVGVLTVIGRDHYSAFKSVEGIAYEKGKLVRALPPHGVAVLNIDDPHIRAIGESCDRRVIWIGRSEGADIRLLNVRSDWPEPLTLVLGYEGNSYEVRTQLHGKHLALSVLASCGVAIALDLPLTRAIDAVRKAQAAEGRMQLVHCGDGVVFVRDDWKAPYWSLQAPLEFMREATAGRKVAVIGTISDFSGDNSAKYKRIGREVRESADLVVFVGPHAHRAVRAKRSDGDQTIQGFGSIRDAATFLNDE